MNASWKLNSAFDPSASSGIALLPAPPRQSGALSQQVPTPTTISGSPSHGRHHIRVCRGTACHIKGSAAVLEALQQNLGILAGNVTPDGSFSLEVVACLNVCGMAPVIAINEQLYPGVTPKQVESLIGALKKDGESHD